jgi:hypothetical protein
MNKLQRFLIISRDGKRVIGTPSRQAFMENSAEKHLDILKEVTGSDDFVIGEIQSFNEALVEGH